MKKKIAAWILCLLIVFQMAAPPSAKAEGYVYFVAVGENVLPLSESNRLHADLGTRHRAAVGMSEATDAVIVVVSEETGVISVAVGGMLKRHLAPQTLGKLLRSELCRDENENTKKQNPLQKLQNIMKKREGGDSK